MSGFGVKISSVPDGRTFSGRRDREGAWCGGLAGVLFGSDRNDSLLSEWFLWCKCHKTEGTRASRCNRIGPFNV